MGWEDWPMKEIDSPDGHDQVPKLGPELIAFIESMGIYFENQGIPRIGGRILGLLMITHKPLAAENIAALLKVSRGSISTNIRLLLISGLVEKASFHGDRTTYYLFSEVGWEQRTEAAIQTAYDFREVAKQGLKALPPAAPARPRLERAIQWSDLLIEYFEKAQSEWRVREP
jgi:predicted transcriptional regulator